MTVTAVEDCSLVRVEKRETEEILSKISQLTLAEMVGTTRGRVSHFMSKFLKQRTGRLQRAMASSGLRVRSSLVKMVRDYSS